MSKLPGRWREAIETVERRVIIDALIACKGVIAQVERAIGISHRTLYHKIKQYGIDPDDYRDAFKRCTRCGITFSRGHWRCLQYVGEMDGLELRNCPECGSTIAIEIESK
jgi:ribosomal protein S27AE